MAREYDFRKIVIVFVFELCILALTYFYFQLYVDALAKILGYFSAALVTPWAFSLVLGFAFVSLFFSGFTIKKKIIFSLLTGFLSITPVVVLYLILKFLNGPF